jgi:hypothetical protein
VHDLVLYCKSYRKDFLRLKRLLASISQFNADGIPFYISTPSDDYPLLIEIIGNQGYEWVSDESIVVSNEHASANANLARYQAMPGGLSQQIVKSEFWRLQIAENYLCLDSDCVFIRPFYRADFLSAEQMPYTVLHQNKEFFQLASDRGHHQVERDLRAEAERVKALFGRSGPNFYCAPAPFIWSAKVWQSLDQEYLKPKGITLWDAVTPEYPETLIYGEALLKYRAIPVLAIEPLFRIYHYEWQYFLMQRLGETEAKVAQHYLGIIYQSAWESHTQLGKSDKSFLSRSVRQVRRLGRYLQSYF